MGEKELVDGYRWHLTYFTSASIRGQFMTKCETFIILKQFKMGHDTQNNDTKCWVLFWWLLLMLSGTYTNWRHHIQHNDTQKIDIQHNNE